jgi:hypothetical protein
MSMTLTNEMLRNETMQNFLKSYEKLTMHVIEGVGGWVRKPDLYDSFPGLRSNTGINERYNSVAEAWEETKQGTYKFCRPRSNWGDIVVTAGYDGVSIAGIGARFLQHIKTLDNTGSRMFPELIAYEHRLRSEYVGLHEDVLIGLRQFRDSICEVLEAVENKESEEE